MLPLLLVWLCNCNHPLNDHRKKVTGAWTFQFDRGVKKLGQFSKKDSAVTYSGNIYINKSDRKNEIRVNFAPGTEYTLEYFKDGNLGGCGILGKIKGGEMSFTTDMSECPVLDYSYETYTVSATKN